MVMNQHLSSQRKTLLQPIIAFTTCPNVASAKQIATALVEQKLAACVNIIDNITSVYRWDSAITEDSEVKLIIKTVIELAQQVEAAIKQIHPYETPEVTAVEMAAISEDYFAWMSDNLKVTDES